MPNNLIKNIVPQELLDQALLGLCVKRSSSGDLDRQIKEGSSANAVDGDGKSPLHLLVGSDFGSYFKIKVLVDAGADKNACDNEGKTPLIRAIINQSVERVEDLLELGFDAKVADRDGKTPHQYVLDPECNSRLRQLIIDNVRIRSVPGAIAKDRTSDAPAPRQGKDNDLLNPLITPNDATREEHLEVERPNPAPANPSLAAKICEAISRVFGR